MTAHESICFRLAARCRVLELTAARSAPAGTTGSRASFRRGSRVKSASSPASDARRHKPTGAPTDSPANRLAYQCGPARSGARAISARRPATRPALRQRREPRQPGIARARQPCRTRACRHGDAASTLGHFVRHPPRTMQERRKHQADTHGGRDRPPAAIPEYPRQPGWMPRREQTFEELLRDIDPNEKHRTHKPQRGQRQRVPRDRPLATQRTTERPQKAAHRNADQQHDPRHQRMQIRMPLPRQLSAQELVSPSSRPGSFGSSSSVGACRSTKGTRSAAGRCRSPG